MALCLPAEPIPLSSLPWNVAFDSNVLCSPLLGLSSEVLLNILSHCPPSTLYLLQNTSSRLLHLIKGEPSLLPKVHAVSNYRSSRYMWAREVAILLHRSETCANCRVFLDPLVEAHDDVLLKTWDTRREAVKKYNYDTEHGMMFEYHPGWGDYKFCEPGQNHHGPNINSAPAPLIRHRSFPPPPTPSYYSHFFSRIHCSACDVDHPSMLFPPCQSHPQSSSHCQPLSETISPLESRTCIGRAGSLRVCAHSYLSYSRVQEIFDPSIPSQQHLRLCNHPDHQSSHPLSEQPCCTQYGDPPVLEMTVRSGFSGITLTTGTKILIPLSKRDISSKQLLTESLVLHRDSILTNLGSGVLADFSNFDHVLVMAAEKEKDRGGMEGEDGECKQSDASEKSNGDYEFGYNRPEKRRWNDTTEEQDEEIILDSQPTDVAHDEEVVPDSQPQMNPATDHQCSPKRPSKVPRLTKTFSSLSVVALDEIVGPESSNEIQVFESTATVRSDLPDNTTPAASLIIRRCPEAIHITYSRDIIGDSQHLFSPSALTWLRYIDPTTVSSTRDSTSTSQHSTPPSIVPSPYPSSPISSFDILFDPLKDLYRHEPLLDRLNELQGKHAFLWCSDIECCNYVGLFNSWNFEWIQSCAPSYPGLVKREFDMPCTESNIATADGISECKEMKGLREKGCWDTGYCFCYLPCKKPQLGQSKGTRDRH
ncbi:hypothetical protein MKZ38_000824 [Zalerion maritima]|uniref:F-box domain-containing protein n=1 Tax=Zalerion maritima TaxID=339359 RepID=A0AAD5RQZ8_9PEZI|nr:hypothetical protein MKZ38_000824 [Zalerion maritima]